MQREQRAAARKRRDQAEIKRIVAEYASSGLNKSEFCRIRGLTWATLTRHLAREQERKHGASAASALVAVEWSGKKPASEKESRDRLAVVLWCGRRIEVQRDFDDATLQRLVNLLEGM